VLGLLSTSPFKRSTHSSVPKGAAAPIPVIVEKAARAPASTWPVQRPGHDNAQARSTRATRPGEHFPIDSSRIVEKAPFQHQFPKSMALPNLFVRGRQPQGMAGLVPGVPKHRQVMTCTFSLRVRGATRRPPLPQLVRARLGPTCRRELVYPMDAGSHPGPGTALAESGDCVCIRRPQHQRVDTFDDRRARFQLPIFSEPIAVAKLRGTTVNSWPLATLSPKIAGASTSFAT